MTFRSSTDATAPLLQSLRGALCDSTCRQVCEPAAGTRKGRARARDLLLVDVDESRAPPVDCLASVRSSSRPAGASPRLSMGFGSGVSATPRPAHKFSGGCPLTATAPSSIEGGRPVAGAPSRPLTGGTSGGWPTGMPSGRAVMVVGPDGATSGAHHRRVRAAAEFSAPSRAGGHHR